MSSSVILGFLAGVILIYAIFATPLALWFFGPPARRVLIALVGLAIALAGMHIVFAPQGKGLRSWLFNLDIEFTAGAVYSSLQYTLIALVALLNAIVTPALKIGQRLYWGLLSALFTWLCLDEFLSLHESFLHWRSAYALGGLALAASSLAAFWFGFKDRADLFIPLIVGLAMIGAAGVVLDALTNDHPLIVAGMQVKWVNLLSCNAPYIPLECKHMNRLGFVEEFLEMTGATLVLATFVNYLDTAPEKAGLRLFRHLSAGAVAVWLAIWIGKMWAIPTLDAAIGTEPIQVEYLDGRLTATGYRISGKVFNPGDDVVLTIFFRAKVPLQEDYRLSTHLMPRYGADSLAQADTELGGWVYPTSAWVPGLSVRERMPIHIPEDTPAPASYWLTMRVWHEDEDVPLSETDRFEVGPGTVVVLSLPVLPEGDIPDPPTAAGYRFSDGFWLTGYSIPRSAAPGGTLPLRFWWKTEARIPFEINQFVHLFDAQGQVALTYDQAPFGGERFPTVDWPAGMEAVAEWAIPLTASLEPGTYDVYTGLYTLPDIQRREVFDAQGQPVPDNAIYLGQITVEAD